MLEQPMALEGVAGHFPNHMKALRVSGNSAAVQLQFAAGPDPRDTAGLVAGIWSVRHGMRANVGIA